MPKLKEANSRVGFQLSIPVGFYSIMTYSTPSVMLPLTRSMSAQMLSVAVNIISNMTYNFEWTAILNCQYSSLIYSLIYTPMYDYA